MYDVTPGNAELVPDEKIIYNPIQLLELVPIDRNV